MSNTSQESKAFKELIKSNSSHKVYKFLNDHKEFKVTPMMLDLAALQNNSKMFIGIVKFSEENGQRVLMKRHLEYVQRPQSSNKKILDTYGELLPLLE